MHLRLKKDFRNISKNGDFKFENSLKMGLKINSYMRKIKEMYVEKSD